MYQITKPDVDMSERSPLILPEHHAVNILLMNPAHKSILQERDDKEGIYSPGEYSMWGGGVEPGESALEAGMRELFEETGLTPSAEEFKLFARYRRFACQLGKEVLNITNDMFVIYGQDEAEVQVLEGKRAVLLDRHDGATNQKCTKMTRRALHDYNRNQWIRPIEWRETRL